MLKLTKFPPPCGGGLTFYYTSHDMNRLIPHIHRAQPLNGFENGPNLAENRIENVLLTLRTHTNTHVHINKHTHTQIHTYTHKYTHTYIWVSTGSLQPNAHTNKYNAHTKNTHTNTHKHTPHQARGPYSSTNTQKKHAHTHTHTHLREHGVLITQTFNQILDFLRLWILRKDWVCTYLF